MGKSIGTVAKAITIIDVLESKNLACTDKDIERIFGLSNSTISDLRKSLQTNGVYKELPNTNKSKLLKTQLSFSLYDLDMDIWRLEFTTTKAFEIFLLNLPIFTQKSKEETLKTAEIFLEIRKRFKETRNFAEIIYYLDSDSDELENISQIDRLKFLGFFDDLYVLYVSGILNINIINQNFGFYIIKAWNNQYMWWKGNLQSSPYRFMMKELVELCKEAEKKAEKYKGKVDYTLL
jgi:hypothetical protein